MLMITICYNISMITTCYNTLMMTLCYNMSMITIRYNMLMVTKRYKHPQKVKGLKCPRIEPYTPACTFHEAEWPLCNAAVTSVYYTYKNRMIILKVNISSSFYFYICVLNGCVISSKKRMVILKINTTIQYTYWKKHNVQI